MKASETAATPTPDQAVTEQTPLLQPAPTKQAQDDLSPARKALCLLCCFLGPMLFAIDSSIVVTLAPSIGSTFNKASMGTALASWFFGGAACFSLLWGKISDIYGRRPLLVCASVVFMLATAGCALAPSMEAILFCRLLAGISGSAVSQTAQVCLSDLYSQRQRGRLQGISNMAMGAGFAAGGPIGGLLNDSVGWRNAFALQLPCLAIITLGYALFVKVSLPFTDHTLTKWQRFGSLDWLGSFTVTTSIFCLIAGLQLGGNVYEWDEWPILAALVAGICGLGLFLLVEARATKPIVALDVLRSRTVAATAVINLCQTVTITSQLYQLPFYYLVVLDLTPGEFGIRLVPQAIAAAVGSFCGGQLITLTGRYQPQLPLAAGLMFLTPLLIVTTWIPNAEKWPLSSAHYFTDVIFTGLGNGLGYPCLIVACIASVPYAQMATVSSVNAFTRIFGQVMGVSLSTAFIQERVKRQLMEALPGQDDLVSSIRSDVTRIRLLPPATRAIAVEAYKLALQSELWITVVVAATAAVVCLFVPQHKLSQKAPAKQDEDDQ